MIIRVSEAHVRPGMRADFMSRLRDLVADFPDRYRGLASHEVAVDASDPDRVLYVSRWLDESALVAYAGEDWRTSPVTFPGEAELLRGPLTLRHLVPDAE